MPNIYHHELTVDAADIDMLGHVNNRVYIKWMEHAGVAHSAANGWPMQRYADAGCGWVAKSHFIEYVKPAFANDEIIVRTWIADFKRVTSLRKYSIERADGQVIAKAETNWAFVRFDTLSPTRILPEVADCFTAVDPS